MRNLPIPGVLAPLLCGMLTAFLSSCSTEPAAEPQSQTPETPDAKSQADNKSGQAANAAMKNAPQGLYAMQHTTLDGKSIDGAAFQGKVSLVVNVASECGYTRQYAGLQKLHSELSSKGFQVVGFPCNDFGGQEPGSPEQIQKFCESKFSVTFPMMAKAKITGDAPSPAFKSLIAATGKTPGWNFCKYLIGKDGSVLGFWKSGTSPDSAELRAAIEKAL